MVFWSKPCPSVWSSVSCAQDPMIGFIRLNEVNLCLCKTKISMPLKNGFFLLTAVSIPNCVLVMFESYCVSLFRFLILGTVLIESAINNCTIISSDCKSGPREILENGSGGFLFKNNDINSFKAIIRRYLNSNNQELKQMKINVKKNIRKYSLLKHYLLLKELIFKQENKA